MAKNLPAVLILEKNKIASINPWLVTLDITLLSAVVLRLVHNTEDIIFAGNTYTAFPFQIEIPNISSKGELPKWMLRISNVNRIFQYYLEAEDGCVGATVLVRFLNNGYLAETYTELETTLQIMSAKSDANWIVFELGMPNPLVRRFPRFRYIADHCAWDFKGAECGYTGSETTCQKTITACRNYNNSARFGGHTGMSNFATRLA